MKMEPVTRTRLQWLSAHQYLHFRPRRTVQRTFALLARLHEPQMVLFCMIHCLTKCHRNRAHLPFKATCLLAEAGVPCRQHSQCKDAVTEEMPRETYHFEGETETTTAWPLGFEHKIYDTSLRCHLWGQGLSTNVVWEEAGGQQLQIDIAEYQLNDRE